MPTDVPPAIASEISAIADPFNPEGARLRKLISRSRTRGDVPDELLAAQLAGIAMDPAAYRRFDNRLSELFRNQSNLNYPPDGTVYPELIIGAGFHGAAYATIRHLRNPGRKPIVLESGLEPGGAFAVTKDPSFYLNSENTAGLPGAPWDGEANALNWLPGAPVQAAQVSGRELIDNTVMRYVIRAALMLHARVITRATALEVKPENGYLSVRTVTGRTVRAYRVIDARGMGPAKDASLADGKTVLTWDQLMSQMDTDYPFTGMRRVAVVGDGKSALCAAEALLGIGPDATMRTPADGFPFRVDMYGPRLPGYRQSWLSDMQTRYARLASHLPVGVEPDPDDEDNTVEPPGYGKYHDLYVYQQRGELVKVPGGVLVNGRFYDCAVLCTGRTPPGALMPPTLVYDRIRVGGRAVASTTPGYEYYRVGPLADLPWETADYSAQITQNRENKVAMFRLGPLTAGLAGSLPDV